MEYETALASKCQTEEEVTVHAGEQPIGDLSSGRSKPAPGRHGVLRYKRETTIPSIPCSLSSQPPQPPVVCEACGEEAQPPLDLLGLERPQLFCCSQHQQLWEWLSHERLPALKTAAQETTPPPDSQPTKEKEAELQAKERDKHRKLEAERKLLCQDNSLLPVDTCTPHSRTISYLLSRCVPVPGQDLDLEPGLDMDPGPGPGLDQQDSQFGLSYPGGLQVGTAVVQRSYPSGGVFLTAFPDGSAQIFYPSGLLALILLVDGERRVCLVYDDHIPNQQPIRAVFHSDGRATCYHSNGSVWLSIGMSGGECVSETGSRVRRWSWGSLGPPASMRSLFLSLNPSLGLRVLGNMQICLRFLSRGCQARVRLGGQPRGAGPPHDPPTSREELLLLAGRVGVHLGLRRLQWCLQTPSSPHPCQAPHLGPLAHRLLERSCTLAHRDRAFIHTCLQDLL